uniref:Uncharacterized protein n=1 Tax=Glossina palpalis gambiensis TaxID=67801 RepID=A0A1B0AUX7_9MUSC
MHNTASLGIVVVVVVINVEKYFSQPFVHACVIRSGLSWLTTNDPCGLGHYYPWIVNSQQTLVVTVVVAAIAATAVTVTTAVRVQCGWQKSATAAFTQHQF